MEELQNNDIIADPNIINDLVKIPVYDMADYDSVDQAVRFSFPKDAQYFSRSINHIEDKKRFICIESEECGPDRKRYIYLVKMFVEPEIDDDVAVMFRKLKSPLKKAKKLKSSYSTDSDGKFNVLYSEDSIIEIGKIVSCYQVSDIS